MSRPLRFGRAMAVVSSKQELVDAARQAEDDGFDVFLVPDHLGTLTPGTALAVAAAATDRIRIGSFVYNNDFRNPLVLAQELVSLDILSDGRLEAGFGAGWNTPEYETAGIPFDRPSTRIERMAESVDIITALFAGETVHHDGEHYTITDATLRPPSPQGADLPILIGGNGDRMLTVAGRSATIVGLMGLTIGADGTPDFNYFTRAGAANRIEFVKNAAGDRADDIEFNVLLQRFILTDDRVASATALVDEWAAERDLHVPLETVLDSPFMLIGTLDEICERIVADRDELGISYVSWGQGRGDGFEEVVRQLAGN